MQVEQDRVDSAAQVAQAAAATSATAARDAGQASNALIAAVREGLSKDKVTHAREAELAARQRAAEAAQQAAASLDTLSHATAGRDQLAVLVAERDTAQLQARQQATQAENEGKHAAMVMQLREHLEAADGAVQWAVDTQQQHAEAVAQLSQEHSAMQELLAALAAIKPAMLAGIAAPGSDKAAIVRDVTMWTDVYLQGTLHSECLRVTAGVYASTGTVLGPHLACVKEVKDSLQRQLVDAERAQTRKRPREDEDAQDEGLRADAPASRAAGGASVQSAHDDGAGPSTSAK